MKKISLELVPRDDGELREDLKIVKKHAPHADVINIPDLLRLPIRSWEGAAIAQEAFPNVMPHIRAMDIDLSAELPMKPLLEEHGIKEVLVIEGDPPQSMAHKVYPTTTVDVIWKFHKEMPDVKVYAGIDQYRGSLADELYRIKRKIQAGAAGFFTQPFFDLSFLGVYADMLLGQEVFWGVTPVLSAASQGYWERKNKVVFPHDFRPTLDWSIDFARHMIAVVEEENASLYVMPIKTDLEAYLTGIFQQ